MAIDLLRCKTCLQDVLLWVASHPEVRQIDAIELLSRMNRGAPKSFSERQMIMSLLDAFAGSTNINLLCMDKVRIHLKKENVTT